MAMSDSVTYQQAKGLLNAIQAGYLTTWDLLDLLDDPEGWVANLDDDSDTKRIMEATV
jgi:hypothetical protein